MCTEFYSIIKFEKNNITLNIVFYTNIYNDYTSINLQIIDEYNLDLKIFYNEIPKFNNIIKEIPMDRINIIVNKAGEIIENSKITKDMTFNMENINNFINLSVKLISSNLHDLGVIYD